MSDDMTDEEARMALISNALVGTSNLQGKGGFCLFSTGYLREEIKVKGRGKKNFLFIDKWGELKTTRPASAFMFMR